MSNFKSTEVFLHLDKKAKKELIEFAKWSYNELTEEDQKSLEELLFTNQISEELDDESFWNSQLVHLDGESQEKKAAILRKRRSRLFKTLERYIVFSELDKLKPVSSFLKARYYVENDLSRNAKSSFKQFKKSLGQEEYWEPEFEVFNYWLNGLDIAQNQVFDRVKGKLDSLEQSLNLFYHINQLRIITTKLDKARQMGFSSEDLMALEKKVEEIYKEYHTNPFIALYNDIAQMYLNKEDPYYQTVYGNFQSLEKTHPQLSNTFKKEITELLMNYCIQKINQGKLEFAEEYLLHFNYMAGIGGLLKQDVIYNFQRIRNGLGISLMAGDKFWFPRFLKDYRRVIEPQFSLKISNPLLAFMQAMWEIHIENGALEKTYDYLMTFQNSEYFTLSPIYRLDCLKMKAKYYFQTRDFKDYKSQLNAARAYLRGEDKMEIKNKQYHQNVLKYFAKNISQKGISENDFFKKLPKTDQIWINNQKRKR